MANATERAYEHIRDGILSGHFEPGQRLKETDLVRFMLYTIHRLLHSHLDRQL